MSEINTRKQKPKSSAGYYQSWRQIKDQLAKHCVVAGGLGVIVAIVLIFFYLLYVVFPLFISASAQSVSQYEIPEPELGRTLLLSMEEQNEVAVRYTDTGQAVFFSVPTGKTIAIYELPVPKDQRIVSFAHGAPNTGVVIYGLDDGRAMVVKHRYKVSYPNDKRVITPVIEYPLGQVPLVLSKQGSALDKVAVEINENMTTVVAKTDDERVILVRFEKEESLFDDEGSFERTDNVLDIVADNINFILIDKDQRNLFLLTQDGRLSYFDIGNAERPTIIQHLNVVKAGEKITNVTFLNGSLSILLADTSGLLSQWSLLRDAQNRPAMQKLRAFKISEQNIAAVNAEQRRKGFVTVDSEGMVGVYHSTAERELIKVRAASSKPVAMSLSPRANALLLQTEDNRIAFWHIENEHPEVSVKSLWQEVWYESYPKPDYIWQSSSASNDFEPKYSLTPLVFGTLKAAFYAMLVAVPLALMGAIYTAYFMAPGMRRLVKPSIEIMEALPTVILGFLAGLWLAPFIEEHLMGIFTLLLVLPISVLVFAFGWQFLPNSLRHKVSEGWDAALLIPVIIISSWLAFVISMPLEQWMFNGNIQGWFKSEFGIGYDQRNSLVVGLAMGFAVVPTIFSIAEDAIFSVPKHLTVGSLALGATPWQTMIKVVLLTASPGIFSAVMIGLGRAVGETMIVLMATGNTPVMDLSVFQGMRTLSANIAVEMPESEVDSTHYRVLFLAALVLFMFTFIVNTLAELVRQRLREKYSSL